MSGASSQGSADSTTDSPRLGFDIRSSVRATVGDGQCCEPGSPASPSTTTYTQSDSIRDRFHPVTEPHPPLLSGGQGPRGHSLPLIFSAAASPAKTCPSPDNDEDSPETDPASSSNTQGSQSLFDPDGFSSRTYPVSSLHRAVGTSEQSLERWPTSGTAWRGGLSTAVSSECRSDADGCSSSEPSLTEILEPPQSVPARYSLSGRAARGILRRAEKRGRELPTHLRIALMAVASRTASPPTERSEAI